MIGQDDDLSSVEKQRYKNKFDWGHDWGQNTGDERRWAEVRAAGGLLSERERHHPREQGNSESAGLSADDHAGKAGSVPAPCCRGHREKDLGSE